MTNLKKGRPIHSIILNHCQHINIWYAFYGAGGNVIDDLVCNAINYVLVVIQSTSSHVQTSKLIIKMYDVDCYYLFSIIQQLLSSRDLLLFFDNTC